MELQYKSTEMTCFLMEGPFVKLGVCGVELCSANLRLLVGNHGIRGNPGIRSQKYPLPKGLLRDPSRMIEAAPATLGPLAKRGT